MSYYTVNRVRNLGRERGSLVAGGTPEALREAAQTGPFDIFLSHSFRDAELTLGVKALLESTGKSVYVDWIHDPLLDRTRVVPRTAETLRRRMRECKALVYASTEAATTSKWMPWELGYFDGLRGGEHVAILPIVAFSGGHPSGQEYVGLYATIQELTLVSQGTNQPFVTRTRDGVLESKSLGGLVTGSGSYQTVGR